MSQASAPPRLADQLRNVKVGLRRDLEISRQVLQGKPCYVLRDGISFQSHSLSARDYQIILALRSGRTVGEAFEELVQQERLKREREDEFYQFVVDLHQRGLLQLPTEDPDRLYARLQRTRTKSLARSLMQLASLKLPLGNPDRWLVEVAPYFRFLFTRWFAVLWACAVLMALLTVVADWERFQQPWASLLAVRNVLFVLVLVVVLKVWHEIGHAVACRHFGGEVPEWGAILIVGTPCAYVDTSAAWGFHRAWHRIVVNLAGMYFESLVALVATVVWISTDTGLLHAAAHQTMIVSTVITLFFNLNPLMKFDGYYVLSDWLGMPNLKQSADRAAIRELKRAAFSVASKPIGRTYWEQRGLVAFGIASALYKVTVIAGLFAVIAYRLPIVGLVAGVGYVVASVLPWMIRTSTYLWTSPETEPHRVRAVTCWFAMIALPFAVLILPLSRATVVAGVLRPERSRIVRAESEGFLESIDVVAGESVLADQPLGTLDNSEVRLVAAKAESELTIEGIRLRSDDRAALGATEAVLRRSIALGRSRQASEQVERLTLRAPIDGTITRVPAAERLGSFCRVGEPLLEVGGGGWRIRTLLTAEQLEDVAPRIGDRASIALPATGRTVDGALVSIAPFGGTPLDLVELSHLGGGEIVVDPQTMIPEQPYFELVFAVDGLPEELLRSGTRVDVSFRSVTRPLASVLYRRWLQFLDRYSKRT
ncbi:MAG TPA: HlyD family efflux transporter periplasmic adaptor subunit [Pirellulaceae bacterium]|nr:HlyD family efflux transporter periplasmic adaptor subunit [Pirellulaceae bacterium]